MDELTTTDVTQLQLLKALDEHDLIMRITDIPPFFGRKEKDTITPRYLVNRIEDAATIAAWPDDARKITEFRLRLRGDALVWWESMEECSWNNIKDIFLKTFEPKFSARDLVQRPGETVNDYHVRVHQACRTLFESMPEALATVRVSIVGATHEEAAAAAKREGLDDMAKFIRHQLFLTGLRDNLREKVLEANKGTLSESRKLARELEAIQQDKHSSLL
jgi:hypothetical protein